MSGQLIGRVLALALAAGLGLTLSNAFAADNIGVTTLVKNQVIGRLAADGGGGGGGPSDAERRLGAGDGIFQDETIETGEDSQAQLLFLDETVLTVGSTAQIVLDSFVYDPDRKTGDIVIDTTKGAFRFISGSAASDDYTIRTPIGTMGIRGTILEWAYDERMLVLILHEGGTELCLSADKCQVLDQPGTYIVTDGEEFSGIRKYKGEGGELILEEGNLDLLLSFLGAQRGSFPGASGPLGGSSPLPPGQTPPPGPPGQPPPVVPPSPPSQPPSFGEGFAPMQTGAGTVPGGLAKQFEAGTPPPGLVKNRDPETFRPPGQQ